MSALALGAAASCASPTLPLPPPTVPAIVPASTAGKVHLASTRGAEPNAIIVIYNQNPGVARDQRVSGTQADAVGTWEADVVATKGDVLQISQEFGTSRSAPIAVQVP